MDGQGVLGVDLIHVAKIDCGLIETVQQTKAVQTGDGLSAGKQRRRTKEIGHVRAVPIGRSCK